MAPRILKKRIVRAIQVGAAMFAGETTETRIELRYRLRARAVEKSCVFIENNSRHFTNYFDRHWDLRSDAVKQVAKEGLLLEFGVNRGRSANFICQLLDEAADKRTLYGFDTFTGLTEDWGGVGRAGLFDRNGKPPHLHKRVQLVTGDILQTLEPFLQAHLEPIAFIHIDTDTYTPCAHILRNVRARLRNGTIIVFDELLGYPNYHSHELKALSEELPRTSYEFKSFGVSHKRANLIKAVIEIVDAEILK